jgi:hypothetical protein
MFKTNHSKDRKGFFRRLIRNRYFLAFFNGFLVATLIYTTIESGSESELFQNIVKRLKAGKGEFYPQDSFVLKAMHITHFMLDANLPVFKNSQFSSFESSVINPATFDLMTTSGMCGSYSRVLARTLVSNDVTVRFAQMEVNGVFGGHIIIEAKVGRDWVVLDPMYDLYFKRPDGKMASFADVQNNWAYYRQQLPPNYNMAYRYEGVRYTNWNKIPIILPVVKQVLYLFIGKERTNDLSLRTYFLRPYHTIFYITLLLFIPVFFYTISKFGRLPKLSFYTVRKDRGSVLIRDI